MPTAAPSLARRIRVVPESVAGSSVPHTCEPLESVARTRGAAGCCCGANHSSPTVTTSGRKRPARGPHPVPQDPA